MATKTTKRSVKKTFSKGIVYVKASFNNTHVTITSPTGEAIALNAPALMDFQNS